MTLLIGAIISIMMSLLKKLSNAIGVEMAKNLVIILMFLLALIYSGLTNLGFVNAEVIIKAAEILASAVGFYEIMVKRILIPMFGE